jgi:hypothetical protein
MVVEKASGRVPGRTPGSSRSRDDDGGGLQYVLGKRDPSLRFFPSRSLYRRKVIVRGGTRRSHHGVVWPGAGPRRPVVRLAPGPPPSHLRSSRSFGKNRRFGFYFVQFREYFLYNFFETQNSRKQGTNTVASW